MKEVFIEIVGFEEHYRISNHGSIISLGRVVGVNNHRFNTKTRTVKQKTLKKSITRSGYVCCNLCNGGKKEKWLVHRLVAMHFIKNPHNKPFVNHIDGVKTNNNFLNLEWCTNLENMRHAYRTGLILCKELFSGEKSIAAKLTEREVIDIKLRIVSGEPCASISNDYVVGTSTIGEIKAGRSWKDVGISMPFPTNEERP